MLYCRRMNVILPTKILNNKQHYHHVPVMMDECLEYLKVINDGLYLDLTLGGGGHTLQILQRGGRVLAFDCDEDAIKNANAPTSLLLKYQFEGKLEIVKSNFRNATNYILSSVAKRQDFDGILLDLGVSSHQIDQAERGFAFSKDGPLSMRLDNDNNNKDKDKNTAAYVINHFDCDRLANILFDFGEETRSR